MLNYIEYLNQYLTIPIFPVLVAVAIFLAINIIGELLEFKGQVVPEFVKIRKYFARKKAERELIQQIPQMMNEWVENINKKLEENDKWMEQVNRKLAKSNEDIIDILIESKRSAIIDFASKVSNEDYPVTREQFNRIFRMYDEYENIIEKNGRTNGEVDVAIRIITDSYETHLTRHTFVENIRGYDV